MENTPSPSTSATPGSTQVNSTPSSYLVVLNPDYHGSPPPPPPPIPPIVPVWTPPPPPPPPVDSTSPEPPSQQDLGSKHEPSENAPSESSHGSQQIQRFSQRQDRDLAGRSESINLPQRILFAHRRSAMSSS
ncbi:hypothetical protein PIB30_057164 [Stylosanthes scabra]|uniref:Uncharacterized protein n=1 Tax=Stylosanthes scabra TaxID=79078 RepID=A0ABU6YLE4_9FABA|nr:hypothetical protein [Stylosanthes scabra]